MNNYYKFVFVLIVGLMIYNKNIKSKEYKPSGGYNKISNMKHDMVKDGLIQLMPLIVLSKGTLYNQKNIFNSIVGTTILNGLGYLLFYQIIEPYILNKTHFF